MAARTAVVAGTATAVSGRVAHRQAARYEQQEMADAYQQQAYAQQAAPPAAVSQEDEQVAKLKELAGLHAQGILSDDEFAAAKAKLLGI